MDLLNNEVGRRLARDPLNAGRDPAEVIREALDMDQLRTSPFRFENGVRQPDPPRDTRWGRGPY